MNFPPITVAGSHEVRRVQIGDPVFVTNPVPPYVNTLEGLTDVEGTATAATGNVLTLGSDGIWRPAPPLDPQAIGFRFDQAVPASVWTIVHNLGRYPAVVTLHSGDLSEDYFGFVVQHLDVNSLRVSMDIPTAGIALGI